MKRQIVFVGIDYWNRPTFREEGRQRYFCDVDNLFPYDEPAESVRRYYEDGGKSLDECLIYKGKYFDSEPSGEGGYEFEVNWNYKKPAFDELFEP